VSKLALSAGSTFSLYLRLGYEKLPEIILFTDIEVTVMIEQAFVFLIYMSSYLWHGRYVEYSLARFDDEISLNLTIINVVTFFRPVLID